MFNAVTRFYRKLQQLCTIDIMRTIILLLLATIITACSLVHISGNNNKLERKDESKLIDFNRGEENGSTTTKKERQR